MTQYTPVWPVCPVCGVTTPEHTQEQCGKWKPQTVPRALAVQLFDAVAMAMTGEPHEDCACSLCEAYAAGRKAGLGA